MISAAKSFQWLRAEQGFDCRTESSGKAALELRDGEARVLSMR